jgi:hypothetical protein
MKDFLVRIATDGAIIAGAVGLSSWYLKKWMSALLKNHFEHVLAQRLAVLDIDKEKLHRNEQLRDSSYAAISELVYRLRNEYRSIVENLAECMKTSNERPYPGELGGELSILVENLYKYRALIDEPTFENLHTFKRSLQDAQVLLNRITRPPTDITDVTLSIEREERIARIEESLPRLREIWTEVDALYEKIIAQVKTQIQSSLKRLKQ